MYTAYWAKKAGSAAADIFYIFSCCFPLLWFCMFFFFYFWKEVFIFRCVCLLRFSFENAAKKLSIFTHFLFFPSCLINVLFTFFLFCFFNDHGTKMTSMMLILLFQMLIRSLVFWGTSSWLFLFLCLKYHIYSCKFQNKRPTFSGVKILVKNNRECAHVIAKKRDKLSFHFKKWRFEL